MGCHYTQSENVESMLKESLVSEKGVIYVTDDPNLSPVQALVDLALRPNRGAYDAVFEDLAGLRSAGYEITGPVAGMRWNGLPGGGMEMQVRTEVIPPEYLWRLKWRRE